MISPGAVAAMQRVRRTSTAPIPDHAWYGTDLTHVSDGGGIGANSGSWWAPRQSALALSGVTNFPARQSLGGTPFIKFTAASSQFLRATHTNGVSGYQTFGTAGARSLFAVIKPGAAGTAQTIVSGNGSGSYHWRVSSTGTLELVNQGGSVVVAGATTVDPSAWHLVEVHTDAADAQHAVVLDGVVDGMASVAWSGAKLMYELGRLSSGSEYFNGGIAAFLHFDAELTEPQKQAVRDALTTEFDALLNPAGGAGLFLWYDASLVSGADNANVPTWTDQSGNDRHANQVLAPKLDHDVFGVGKHGIKFGGAAEYYDLSSFAAALGALTEAEAFVVFKVLNDPPSFNRYGFWKLGSSNQVAAIPGNDGTLYDTFGSTAQHALGNPAPSLTTPRLYNVATALGEFTARLDTAQLYTTASNTVGWHASPWLGLSRHDAGFTNYSCDLWMAEVRIYSTRRTPEERAAIEAELKTKWGLTGY